jgi:hypothetical protein
MNKWHEQNVVTVNLLDMRAYKLQNGIKARAKWHCLTCWWSGTLQNGTRAMVSTLSLDRPC